MRELTALRIKQLQQLREVDQILGATFDTADCPAVDPLAEVVRGEPGLLRGLYDRNKHFFHAASSFLRIVVSIGIMYKFEADEKF